jgi:predicted ester cyclase
VGDLTPAETIRAAVAALNAGDVDSYLNHFAPSCQRWIAGFDQPLLLPEVAENLRRLVEAFDPLQLGEELLIADGEYVCARWQLRGVQVGEFLGVPCQSGRIDVATCEIYEVVHEQVTSSWVYQDPGQMFTQMAADPREHGHE